MSISRDETLKRLEWISLGPVLDFEIGLKEIKWPDTAEMMTLILSILLPKILTLYWDISFILNII